MTKGTRYFIAIASLVVAAGVCTAAVAYYNGGLPLLARAAQDDLAYVPADASVVAYANVRDIMNSEFRQKLREKVATGEGRNEFLDETGIDLERDVTSVLVAAKAGNAFAGAANAVDPSKFVKGKAEQGVALVRGVFQQAQIEAAATRHGAVQTEYKGKRMLTATFNENDHAAEAGAPARDTSAGPKPAFAVAFIEPGLVAVGSEAAVREAIDAAAGNNLRSNAEMMRMIGDLDANNNAWAVGRLDDASRAALPEVVQNQLPAVQWFAVSGHINGGLSGTLRAEARDDKAAENLRDVVRGAMALARLQMGHDQNIDAVINSLQMTGTGKTVTMSFAVPPQVLDSIAGFANAAADHHQPAPLQQKQ